MASNAGFANDGHENVFEMAAYDGSANRGSKKSPSMVGNDGFAKLKRLLELLVPCKSGTECHLKVFGVCKAVLPCHREQKKYAPICKPVAARHFKREILARVCKPAIRCHPRQKTRGFPLANPSLFAATAKLEPFPCGTVLDTDKRDANRESVSHGRAYQPKTPCISRGCRAFGSSCQWKLHAGMPHSADGTR